MKVGPDDSVVPDGGVLLDGDVSDDRRRGRDECGGVDAGRLSLEGIERHAGLLADGLARSGLPGSPRRRPAHLALLPWTRQGVGRTLCCMIAPRIAAVATATPSHRWDQDMVLRRAGYQDSARVGVFAH